MRPNDACPEDALDFACWRCLDRGRTCPDCGPEYDKDDSWSRAQEAEMYGHDRDDW
jgi:hypothetical protein